MSAMHFSCALVAGVYGSIGLAWFFGMDLWTARTVACVATCAYVMWSER